MNNRQAGRRNRGRNNGRPNGQNRGGGESGNRIDSRARGNAAQLLEKYRNMARDAQLAGDRVNMEYYLQFADHYFRVLADNRARQEEQNPQRFRRNDDNFFDGDDFDGAGEEGGEGEGGERQAQPFNAQRGDEGGRFEGRRDEGRRDDNRRERNDDGRRDRGERNDGRNDNRRNRDFNRQPRGDENAAEIAAYQPQPAPVAQASEPAPVVAEGAAEEPAAAPRRRGRPRKVQPEAEAPEIGFDAAILPPAISRADNDSDGDGEPAAEAPRRRGRPRRAAAPEAAE